MKRMESSEARQSRLLTPADENQPAYRIKWLTRIVYGNPFELTIVGLILLNAVGFALLTLPGLDPGVRSVALAFDSAVVWVFVVEIVARIASFGSKPWKFFTTGWNVFDFLVVALIPLFSGQTVILRLLRLLRVVRLFRFLPEVRILTRSITRSMPPLLSVSVLILFLLFVYAMAGHYLFGEALPNEWGDIGLAMQSLFILLTLENFPSYFLPAMDATWAALPYFLSYVFVIVFTILNVLIGIVINAMDEAREEDNAAAKAPSLSESDLHNALDEISRQQPQLSAQVEEVRRGLRSTPKT